MHLTQLYPLKMLIWQILPSNHMIVRRQAQQPAGNTHRFSVIHYL